MELSSQEGDIPIPINSSSTTYSGGLGHGHGHGHMIHHDYHPHNPVMSSPPQPHNPSSNGINTTINIHSPPALQENSRGPHKKLVRYRECLKNHAASMGGNATDGCGEFMPSGEEGTIEALNCSACNCHRNFHRKEVEGEPSSFDYQYINRVGRRLILGHHKSNTTLVPHEGYGYPTTAGNVNFVAPSRAVAPPHHQMIMPYSICPLPSESDEQDGGGGGNGGSGIGGGVAARPPHHLVKKRFRTKFTPEQKEKMFNFAEKVGWKIQKQEDSVVQQFCQEIGVRRRVLKVWMHNNKHNLAKKNPSNAA